MVLEKPDSYMYKNKIRFILLILPPNQLQTDQVNHYKAWNSEIAEHKLGCIPQDVVLDTHYNLSFSGSDSINEQIIFKKLRSFWAAYATIPNSPPNLKSKIFLVSNISDKRCITYIPPYFRIRDILELHTFLSCAQLYVFIPLSLKSI